MDLLKLKSGSDIRGTAIEGVKGQSVDLTDEALTAISDAFVIWAKKKLGKPLLNVGVGHDSRLSADRIKNIVMSSLVDGGFTVYDCGLCSTPSMFMMTKYPQTHCDAAIMITASHHPFNKNGLKFFLASGGLEGSDISEILAIASCDAEANTCVRKAATSRVGKVIKGDFLQLYCDCLVDKVKIACDSQKPLAGFKIVVDAGNGAGGFYADRVLAVLGADVTGSQFLEPNGLFPNHIPNPENKEAMESISRCVIANKADLGIIFDTDVDRSAIVDSAGNEINRNKLIALISAILLIEKPNGTIVTDSITSDGLAKFISDVGGHHHRFKRGYKNVINEAIRLESEGEDCPLAIETSGHAALKENYFLDDGAYLVTRIIIKMAQMASTGKKVTSLIDSLDVPVEELEIRLTFDTPKWKELGNTIITYLTKFAKETLTLAPSTFEGVRASVSASRGWFLVRMSVHDPIMPINIESNMRGGVKEIAKLLAKELSKFTEGGLVITNLLKVL